MRQIFLIFLSSVIIFIIFSQPGIAAMSITGTTGLVGIPTARVMQDGKIAFGIGYTDNEYSLYGPKYAQIAYYVTVGYLPFLELSLRVTSFPKKMEVGAYGSVKDRMGSVKLRIMNESIYLPSVLLGIHDVMGTVSAKNVHFNAAYIVMSKSIHHQFIGLLDIHLGYASDVMMKEARDHSIAGTFAGMEMKLFRHLVAMAEYDTQKYNVGLRLKLWGGDANIDLVMLGLKHISGGMSVSLNL